MKLILQRHRFSCGATAIAMAADVPLSVAEAVNGVGRTRPSQLIASLRTLGVTVLSDRLIRCSRTRRPGEGDIVRICWRGESPVSRTHWAVKADRTRYFDSVYGSVDEAFYARKGGHITSYLPVARAQRTRVVRVPHVGRPTTLVLVIDNVAQRAGGQA
jgi:hypothetical protein